MNIPFTRGDYAVMRHAQFQSGQLIQASRDVCVSVSSQLADRLKREDMSQFAGNVFIFHSPLVRAELTAGVVYQILVERGIVNMGHKPVPLPWLNCERYLINENRIAEALHEMQASFGLFVSHMPDIERFIGREYGNVSNCSLYSGEFTIQGH